MKRRHFIILIGVATGAVIIPPSLYFISPKVKEYAVKLITNELYYLNIAPDSVEKYVDDFFLTTGNNIISTAKWKALYYLGYTWRDSERIKDLIKYFLLSTDFFLNKTDESKVVNYLGFYGPYTGTYVNPFSFIVYPSPNPEES